jgi:hypothetical protein
MSAEASQAFKGLPDKMLRRVRNDEEDQPCITAG